MGSFRVVEPDPVFDHPFGFEAVLQFVQMDGLLFEGSPLQFYEDIFEIAPASVLQDFDIGFSQGRDPSRTCKLRSLDALLSVKQRSEPD